MSRKNLFNVNFVSTKMFYNQRTVAAQKTLLTNNICFCLPGCAGLCCVILIP